MSHNTSKPELRPLPDVVLRRVILPVASGAIGAGAGVIFGFSPLLGATAGVVLFYGLYRLRKNGLVQLIGRMLLAGSVGTVWLGVILLIGYVALAVVRILFLG
jgi:hypothetical protein